MSETALQALIFDVDGTLADTESAHRAAVNEAVSETGAEGQADMGAVMKAAMASGSSGGVDMSGQFRGWVVFGH